MIYDSRQIEKKKQNFECLHSITIYWPSNDFPSKNKKEKEVSGHSIKSIYRTLFSADPCNDVWQLLDDVFVTGVL